MHRWRTSRIKSFSNAFAGVWFNLRREPNFLIQLIFGVLVIVAGVVFSIHRIEWILLTLSIGGVLSAEAMNTAVEKICDRFLDEKDPKIQIIKDSAAAAVLVISMAAAVVGVLVFWPYVKLIFE